MACVGRQKVCNIVPSNHFGPIPGVEVGTLWKFRVQVSMLDIGHMSRTNTRKMIDIFPSLKEGASCWSYAYSKLLILKNIATINHRSYIKSSMNNINII